MEEPVFVSFLLHLKLQLSIHRNLEKKSLQMLIATNPQKESKQNCYLG